MLPSLCSSFLVASGSLIALPQLERSASGQNDFPWTLLWSSIRWWPPSNHCLMYLPWVLSLNGVVQSRSYQPVRGFDAQQSFRWWWLFYKPDRGTLLRSSSRNPPSIGGYRTNRSYDDTCRLGASAFVCHRFHNRLDILSKFAAHSSCLKTQCYFNLIDSLISRI